MTRDLTDGEITDMARKSRFARDLDERDAGRRLAWGNPPSHAAFSRRCWAEAPKPKTPAGGAAVT
jgi:hypothetical protein